VLHILGENENYYIVNEAEETYTGTITLPAAGNCYAYNAWDNRLETVEAEPCGNGTKLYVNIEPRKSLIVFFGQPPAELHAPVKESGNEIQLSGWKRSVCNGVDYPAFGEAVPVTLPDKMAEEQPEFSGFVRYTARFNAESNCGLVLVIDEASEGVEVFVNGQSAGIQIVPSFRFDISALVKPGENELVVEVATTLERMTWPMLPERWRGMGAAPSSQSGLTGRVRLFYKCASAE
jgi:hypothetical protein